MIHSVVPSLAGLPVPPVRSGRSLPDGVARRVEPTGFDAEPARNDSRQHGDLVAGV
ncbi:hypothetical protein [Micromonospora sp. 15K316]|uniref:hypothetical protein n=1 Tax=Micromonospora sp. 15K316 TaxID=2530376 RepID=UPI001405157F|nr:hypothetical protein [Micromonospora sp. 15K316]